MATVLDLTTVALKEIGVLAAGEVPNSEDAADALAALNRLIDQWAAERLQIYTITRTPWTIVSGTQNYAVGTGVTVNVARPVYVEHVSYLDTTLSPNQEIPLGELTDAGYQQTSVKALTGSAPTSFYYNPTYPTGTISLFPVPTSSTLQGVLYSPVAVARFAATSDTVALPPGYEEMIVTSLALRLATPYGRQPDPMLLDRQREARAIVKRSNWRPADLSFDAGSLINGHGVYSIYTG